MNWKPGRERQQPPADLPVGYPRLTCQGATDSMAGARSSSSPGALDINLARRPDALPFALPSMLVADREKRVVGSRPHTNCSSADPLTFLHQCHTGFADRTEQRRKRCLPCGKSRLAPSASGWLVEDRRSRCQGKLGPLGAPWPSLAAKLAHRDPALPELLYESRPNRAFACCS